MNYYKYHFLLPCLNVFEKNVEKTWDTVEWDKATNNKIMYNVDKYEYTDHENGMKKWNRWLITPLSGSAWRNTSAKTEKLLRKRNN